MAIDGSRTSKGWAYIPEQRAFELWWELGSLEKASAALEREGYTNPRTDKAPSVMGIRAAAYRWICYNMPEARELFAREYEWARDDRVWGNYVVKRIASVAFSNSRSVMEQFVQTYGLEKFYDQEITGLDNSHREHKFN